MPSRETYEAMLIALEVADTWGSDDGTARLAAAQIDGAELAAGLVSLVRTLRRTLANQTGRTVDEINYAIRVHTLAEMDTC